MTKKLIKLLTTAILINTPYNSSYCMEDTNPISNIDIGNVKFAFNRILKNINDNKKSLTLLEEQSFQYQQQLFKIIKDMQKLFSKDNVQNINDWLQLSLNACPSPCDCFAEGSSKLNDKFNNISKLNTQRDNITIKILECNEKRRTIESEINKQIPEFYNNLFGNNFNNFSIILSQIEEKDLNVIREILSIEEVLQYLKFPEFDKKSNITELKKEYDSIDCFMKEFNSISDNSWNNVKAEIINIVKKCVSNRKDSISYYIKNDN